MNVTITGRHMEMTPALRSHIESGLAKITSHFDRVIDADVVLDVQKTRHMAEVNLHANGLRIHGRETTEDMYASVDAVIAKLDRQIKKYKTRINRHQPRLHELPDFDHAIVSVEPANGNGAGQEEHEHPKSTVVLREKLRMKPLSVDEAVMQLELVDDPFLVFSNAETSRVNVLYRRDGGTYGLIEPQF